MAHLFIRSRDSSVIAKNWRSVVNRSNNNANANGGVSYANANNGSTNANTNIGCRLANLKLTTNILAEVIVIFSSEIPECVTTLLRVERAHAENRALAPQAFRSAHELRILNAKKLRGVERLVGYDAV